MSLAYMPLLIRGFNIPVHFIACESVANHQSFTILPSRNADNDGEERVRQLSACLIPILSLLEPIYE